MIIKVLKCIISIIICTNCFCFSQSIKTLIYALCRKMSKIWIYALFEESYHYKFLLRGKLSLFPALSSIFISSNLFMIIISSIFIFISSYTFIFISSSISIFINSSIFMIMDTLKALSTIGPRAATSPPTLSQSSRKALRMRQQ